MAVVICQTKKAINKPYTPELVIFDRLDTYCRIFKGSRNRYVCGSANVNNFGTSTGLCLVAECYLRGRHPV
jgi:hypothetical protein